VQEAVFEPLFNAYSTAIDRLDGDQEPTEGYEKSVKRQKLDSENQTVVSQADGQTEDFPLCHIVRESIVHPQSEDSLSPSPREGRDQLMKMFFLKASSPDTQDPSRRKMYKYLKGIGWSAEDDG
jgi:hypothetical protein